MTGETGNRRRPTAGKAGGNAAGTAPDAKDPAGGGAASQALLVNLHTPAYNGQHVSGDLAEIAYDMCVFNWDELFVPSNRNANAATNK